MEGIQKRLRKTDYMVPVPLSKKEMFIYHSLYKNPLVIDSETIRFLDLFNDWVCPEELKDKYDIKDMDKWISYYQNKKYLIAEGINEREELALRRKKMIENISDTPQFPAIGFTTGTACNFNCSYCMSNRISDASGNHGGYSLPFNLEIAKRIVDNYLTDCINRKMIGVQIGFSGGEPLLYWDKIKELISYISDNFGPKITVKFTFNSNVSLVDAGIAEFMSKHDVIVSVSIDGYNEKYNDSVRVFKSGEQSTYESIMNGCSILRNYGMKIDGFYLTLVKNNFDFSINELIKFALNNNFKSITVEPDLLGGELSIDEVTEKLIGLEKACLKHDINLVGFWKRPFEQLVKDHDFPDNAAFCQTLRGRTIAITNEGFLKICAYSDEIIGSVSEISNIRQSSKYISKITENMVGQIEICKNCEIEAVCIGGCYLTREYSKMVSDKNPFELRCALYKEITKALIRLHYGE